MITLEDAAKVVEIYLRAHPKDSPESVVLEKVIDNFRTMDRYYKQVKLIAK